MTWRIAVTGGITTTIIAATAPNGASGENGSGPAPPPPNGQHANGQHAVAEQEASGPPANG